MRNLVLTALLLYSPAHAQQVDPRPYCDDQSQLEPLTLYDLEKRYMDSLPKNVCRDYRDDACFEPDWQDHKQEKKSDLNPLYV